MKSLIKTFSGLVLAVHLLSGCSSPFAGDTLAAMPVDGEPGEADWQRAVPLDITVWMGNVNVPDDIVSLDMETSHRTTPDCHHGPSTSDPVPVRMLALYNREELFLYLRWEDRTPDRDLGGWERGPEGWIARPGADDGIAILWGPPGPGADEEPFRCQSACHMMEVDVYDGGTKMRMGMKAPDTQAMDLWRWRAGVTDPFGLADDMIVDASGKRGDEGQVLPRENRSAATPGPDRAEGSEAPYYLVERPRGRQGHVRAESFWSDGLWHLVLRRALDTGDPDDALYAPGENIPFSVSVFDSTFSEHHVSGNSAVLVLWQGREKDKKRRFFNEPMDF